MPGRGGGRPALPGSRTGDLSTLPQLPRLPQLSMRTLFRVHASDYNRYADVSHVYTSAM
uniref:Serine/threonine kinase 33 n=1 Tax=Molossus molossus TaxID=27622 RepID=A0A7J8EUY9_MOLMO|nr:serine/threonine kinase 33 [Molossus molossus]